MQVSLEVEASIRSYGMVNLQVGKQTVIGSYGVTNIQTSQVIENRFISNYNIMFMDDVEEVVADAGTESETSEAVVAEEATEVA